MTEQQWLECQDPRPMLLFLAGKAGDRKFRLFAVACCRRLFHLPANNRHRQAVELAERYADGQATFDELISGRASIGRTDISVVFAHAASPIAWHAAEWAIRGAGLVANERAERAVQAELFRCIFKPFQPCEIDPGWRTPTVTALGRAVYEEKAFDRLPILADALEDAGCDNAAILNQCRQPGGHVRGCWVLDLILGKE